MDYKKKIIYRSNGWYNEGLRRAKRRDMTGAIEALRTSLKYCSDNIAARNLLGLSYYGIGEVTEALIHWIISKNMRPKDNIAVRYIEQVQRESKKLEEINQAFHRYNQCLEQCRQNGEDMAVLQLQKVVASHPSFLRAYQLLALIYMKTGKYSAAEDTLQVALRLDRANKQTLKYVRELSRMSRTKKGRLLGGVTQSFKPVRQREKDRSKNRISLKSSGRILREAAGHFAAVNFLGGLLVGMIVLGGLFLPGVLQKQKDSAQQQARQYSERINALKAQSDALQKTLSEYRNGEQKSGEDNASASYDYLMQAWQQHGSSDYTDESVADSLLLVDRDVLGTWGQSGYDALSKEIFPKVLPGIYEQGKGAYEQQNYKDAASALEKVAVMDESYDNGNALLMLGESLIHEKDYEKAGVWLNKLVSDFATADQMKKAQALLQQIGAENGADKKEQTGAEQTSGEDENTQEQSEQTQEEAGGQE